MRLAAPYEMDAAVAHALAQIAAQAGEADSGGRSLEPDMMLLGRAGVLRTLCDARTAPEILVTILRRIGRASLSVGRLVEGHMNALKLIARYGSAEQKHRYQSAHDRLFGVWGADGALPVRLQPNGDGSATLDGEKRFASGLGVLHFAIVSAATELGTQLAIVRADDKARADASGWKTSGMRATASGVYSMRGLEAELLGGPGDYEREPFFQGGVWRYAALHVGALEAIAEAVRRAVVDQGGGAEAPQLHRLARLTTRAHSARLLVEDAARRVEAPGAGPLAVALALAAREAVEEACLDGIAIADRALGTRSFIEGYPVERIRRDLAFFLRQADLDGKLSQVGVAVLVADHGVGELWSDE
ncbi:acyl-CoA dehydrogenase family protein [Frigidibacter sp. MR17.24]|uniref:acyl-CoA dehydrogenase family protein n=1 Tax=Frigidibacter sp. MR17.24 TaxID=3127345 RepID=UPI003012B18B